jgi:hypothetical protein
VADDGGGVIARLRTALRLAWTAFVLGWHGFTVREWWGPGDKPGSHWRVWFNDGRTPTIGDFPVGWRLAKGGDSWGRPVLPDAIAAGRLAVRSRRKPGDVPGARSWWARWRTA